MPPAGGGVRSSQPAQAGFAASRSESPAQVFRPRGTYLNPRASWLGNRSTISASATPAILAFFALTIFHSAKLMVKFQLR